MTSFHKVTWIQSVDDLIEQWQFRTVDYGVIGNNPNVSDHDGTGIIRWERQDTIEYGQCFKAAMPKSINRIIFNFKTPEKYGAKNMMSF